MITCYIIDSLFLLSLCLCNNPHVEIQHQELLTIYKWFCLNRPYTLQVIIASYITSYYINRRVKTSPSKPQLFLTKSLTQRGKGGASRPQSAPAALGYISSVHTSQACNQGGAWGFMCTPLFKD